MFIVQFGMNAAFGVMIYVWSILVNNGEMTIGNITIFMLYMIQLVIYFGLQGIILGQVFKIAGASTKIIEFMQAKNQMNTHGGVVPPPSDQPKGEIELQNVSFSYPSKKDVKVLKNISLKIKTNQVVAFVGHSGCGKSSIISLIERFYDPEDGNILYNGVDIKDLEPRWYHQEIAIVQQEPILFSGTIKTNILYGLNEDTISQEDLDSACKQSNSYNFIHDEK